MKHHFFIEPAVSSDSSQEEELIAGIRPQRLRQVVLLVPGVEKLYPRPPYWLQAVQGNRTSSGRRAASGASSVTVIVRLGLTPGVDVPHVAREVGRALTRELPEALIEVEVASC